MYKNKTLFFDNRWHVSNSKNIFKYKNFKKSKISVVNPLDKEITSLINSSSIFQELWKKKSNIEKFKILKLIANQIKKNQKILAKEEMFDTGKSYNQAISEIKYCYKLWLHASETIQKIKEKKIFINKKTFCKISYEPIGVTAVIVPWNFPFIVLSERLPYILASGCVGIIKPSEYASGTLIKFVDLVMKIGKVPKGLINLITGGSEIGSKITTNKKVKCISFTGSSFTGRKVMRAASRDLKRISLELGGKNPIIIFNEANLKNAAKNVFTSFTHNSGQCCVGASRIFVEDQVYEQFLKYFKEILNKNSKYFQMSNFMQYEKVLNFLRKKKINKNQIFHGKIPDKKNKNLKIKPIVFHNLSQTDKIHTTELFGPIITVEKFKNHQKVKKIIDKSNYGLACMIWTNNILRAQKFIKGIQIGRLWINGNIKQNYPNIPIGGFKWSGIGRETGDAALQNYSETKSTIINY